MKTNGPDLGWLNKYSAIQRIRMSGITIEQKNPKYPNYRYE